MRVFVCGDTHGNTRYFRDYLYPIAAALDADAILQLGDFGFWEHTDEGVAYLDQLADCAEKYDLWTYFVRGNHDNIELLRHRYHTEEYRTVEGFYPVRPGVLHIPDGCRWRWGGVKLAAFGGAYSIDKDLRLNWEAKRLRGAWSKEHARRDAGRPHKDVPSTAGTLWFPGEELTDAEVDAFLVDTTPVDIVVSHDKPRSAGPSGFKNFPECIPNQDRLQKVLTTLTPRLWMHGHLHHRYDMSVPTGSPDDTWCSVMGLSCDDNAAGRFWRDWQSWALLELGENDIPIKVTPGGHESLEQTMSRVFGEED